MGRTRAQGRQSLRESARSLSIPGCGPFQPSLGSPFAHVSAQPSPLRRGPAAPAAPAITGPATPGPIRLCRLPARKSWGARTAHRARAQEQAQPQAQARAGPDHRSITPGLLCRPRLGSPPLLPFPAPSPARPQAHAPHSHTRTHRGTQGAHTARADAALKGQLQPGGRPA